MALGFGLLWMVITLSPVSNLLFLSGILLAERTLYLPSVGFVAAAAWLFLRYYQERPRFAVGALVLALSLCAARSWNRSPRTTRLHSSWWTQVHCNRPRPRSLP